MSEKLSKEKQKDTQATELANLNESGNTGAERTQLPESFENNTSGRVETEVPVEQEDAIKNPEQMEKFVTQVIEQKFIGPIPPPNIIANYEDVIPGAADRIISMAEQQSAHRQQMEMMEVRAETRDSLLGVIFAFMLGIGCIVACIIMVIKVPAAAGVICGSILGVTGIASIVTAFLKNTRRSNA